MLSDFNKNTSSDKEFHAGFCIIGSGPAELTLTVEAGSYDFSEESQDLYRGENRGLDYLGLEHTRLRYFGGTSNHW